MFLTCPRCNTRYLVDPKTIGAAGRTVRCAACSHSWFQTPPEPAVMQKSESVSPPPAEPTPPPIPPGSALPVIVKKQEAPLWLKAACVALFFITLGGALALYHTPLTRAVPALKSLYAGFGAYDTGQMALADISLTRLPNNANKFIIRGTIVNQAKEPRLVPRLRISLVDGEQRVLQQWDSPAVTQMLPPGGTLPFATQTLDNTFDNADHFVIDIGNKLELSLR